MSFLSGGNNPFPQMPPLGRMMVFVDGENLTMRFQEMVATGRTPRNHVHHLRDTYAWSHNTVTPMLNVVHRATYYTYVQGDELTVDQVALQIRDLTFANYFIVGAHHSLGWLHNKLAPCVFKKARGARAKGVDIQLTVDVLTHCQHNNLDVVYLVAGDGDYRPLILEAQRIGKRVRVAALSNGLSPQLKLVADEFIDLDNEYFVELPSSPTA